jgi:isochorismate synthase
MNFIFERMKHHKRQNLPFVLYRKPNSKTIVGVFQENDHVYFSDSFTEKGFIFSSFNGDRSVIFPLEFCEVSFGACKIDEENNPPINDNSLSSANDKEQFTELVKKGIATIKKGILDKVVLSRTETIPFDDFKTRKTAEKLFQQYPTAFCYCWFHPKIGLWMGATPEKLVYSKKDTFQTTALAGTKPYEENKELIWGEKEKKEQQFVTQFIVENIQKLAAKVVVSDPYSYKAGNIVHLKTDIQGTLLPEFNLKNVINMLHPTPAVCGLPQLNAKEFIENNEYYEREFYSGFLGELNYDFNKTETATDLFVNLRCMKIKDNEVHLYMGCGITKDSNPDKEWEETVLKSKTMKKIL